MRERCIYFGKLLIGAAFFLWCMGCFATAATNSCRTTDKITEFARGARVGGNRVSNIQPDAIHVHPWVRLAYTAEELKERIRTRAQPPESQVGKSQSPPASKAPKAPKAIISGPEPEDYLTANCADLRLLLVRLLRQVNALDKRQHSSFSALTDAEKHELAETNEKLIALRAMLKARCSVPSSK